jgi:trehalose utilization protein
MYGEFFDIPEPDELVFVSGFSGGEVFRSGCCWRRGRGKVFYFSPGDQEYPVYHHPDIKRVLANAVQWAAPTAVAEIAAPAVRNEPGPLLAGSLVGGVAAEVSA